MWPSRKMEAHMVLWAARKAFARETGCVRVETTTMPPGRRASSATRRSLACLCNSHSCNCNSPCRRNLLAVLGIPAPTLLARWRPLTRAPLRPACVRDQGARPKIPCLDPCIDLAAARHDERNRWRPDYSCCVRTKLSDASWLRLWHERKGIVSWSTRWTFGSEAVTIGQDLKSKLGCRTQNTLIRADLLFAHFSTRLHTN